MEASAAPECYICCEDTGVIFDDVCDCKNALMHLKCQQRMLDAAPVATLHDLTRCRVCRKQFRNAETYGYWHLSQTGVLWLAWVVGAIVMFWSANTVLDKGSASDMRLVRLHFRGRL